jgi:beta-glucosidase-like glycosyl hydrolase
VYLLFCYTLLSAYWSENTLSQLSRAEKIGQLIAARIENSFAPEYVEKLIHHYKVGTFIPLQYWTLEKHTEIIHNLHNLHPDNLQTPVAAYGSVGLCAPILVIEDSEWGINMHIPEMPSFPKAMTLAATHNLDLIYRVGYAIGTQCAAIGIHMNIAPVVDVNADARNPVIGMRSFGDTAETVTTYALAYAQGLIDAGIMPCLKHFPGHGTTHTDPHITLPILTDPLDEEKRAAIFNPFFDILQQLPCSVMVGHIAYPALEIDGAIKPASCSHSIIKLLAPAMNPNTLIISDALNMGALAAYGDPGDIALQALKAGIDILLCPPDIDAVINRISETLDTGEYTEKELDAHVLKILQVKEALGLHEQSQHKVQALNLYKDLIQEAYDAAATACNSFDAITFSNITHEPVTLGSPQAPPTPFYDPATRYTKPLLIQLYPGNYKTHRLSAELENMLTQIAEQYPGSIVLLFGSPYCVMDIPRNLPTVVLYEDTPFTHTTAQKIMNGELSPEGKLPIALI